MLVCCGLTTTSSSQKTIFRHCFKLSLSRSGSRETQHWKNITRKHRWSPSKGLRYNSSPDAHLVEQRSNNERYLPHHEGTKWCSEVSRYLIEQTFAHWHRLAPELNPCTTHVPSTSIYPVRWYRGYVPPGWCPRPWPAITAFFVAGEAHNKCCSVSIPAPYFWNQRLAHLR